MMTKTERRKAYRHWLEHRTDPNPAMDTKPEPETKAPAMVRPEGHIKFLSYLDHAWHDAGIND